MSVCQGETDDMPKQILLVEDSVTMQKVVQITFAREDYQIVATTSVDEALAKCKEHRPDVVLADASLPGKTGYDLAAALRADGALKDVPVLLMTGHFNPYDEARAQRSGIDAHLVKPFDTQSLLDKVAGLVKGRAATSGAPAAAAAKLEPAPAPVKPVVAATPPEGRSTMMGMAAPPVAATKPVASPPVAAASARNAASQPGTAPASSPASSPTPVTEGSRMPEPVRASAPTAGIPSQVPQMPRPSLIPRAPVPAPVLAALERIAARGAEYEAIAKLSAEAIQQIVWEVVPELAEVIIRAEVDRLAKERKA